MGLVSFVLLWGLAFVWSACLLLLSMRMLLHWSLNLLDIETFESFAMNVIVLLVCGASMRIFEKHVKLNKSDFFGNVRRTDSEKIPPTARYCVRYVHGLL